MTVITDAQLAALNDLAGALLEGTYLAGGVAVATWFDHRPSRDLDLFVPQAFDAERLAERMNASVAAATVVASAESSLDLELRGVPVSLLGYRYPMLEPPSTSPRVPVVVAGQRDLVAMKLAAIASRTLARDFWDLHVLLTQGLVRDLDSALSLYQKKYVRADPGHVIRSLVYFAEADGQPLPAGLTEGRWAAIRADFERWVLALD